jgi:O-antigen/teichoic acid export membrane protein
MLKHFLSLSDVGIFGVGYRLASIISILLLGVQSSLAPLIYNSLNNPRIKQEVANIFVKFSALALIGLIIIHIFGSDILHFAVNPKFATAVTTMKNMSIAILFSQLYVFTPGLQITKKTSGILYINLFGCLTNLALCYVFVKYFGLNGASFASMVSYIAVFMLYYISSQKVYPIPFPMFKILLNLAIFIAVVAFSHFFQIDLALKIILALSLSLVILALNFKPRNIFKN